MNEIRPSTSTDTRSVDSETHTNYIQYQYVVSRLLAEAGKRP